MWSAVGVYVQALSFLLALFCIFSVATPQVSAAGNTPTEQSAFIRAAASIDHFIADMGQGLLVVGELLTGENTQAAAVATASSLTSVQANAILDLLQSFGADQKTVSNVAAALRGANKQEVKKAIESRKVGSTTPKEREFKEKPALPSNASLCAVFARTLKKGAVGEDVARLQAFLKESGDFNEATSTYFGSKTEVALKQWQARMNVATSGDADITGFGKLGPKTRELLGINCKGPNGNLGNKGSVGTTSPVCILKADKKVVTASTTVVLTWESKNATYAGSATGEHMPPQGSITVTPTESTTYVKKVYGPQGEGSCAVNVEVQGSQTHTNKVVVAKPRSLLAPLTHLLSQMQLGAVVVAETLFGASNVTQTAAVATASSLTSVQINAILSLLLSFGADQTTINNVAQALGATTPAPSAGAGTVTLSVSPSPAAQTFVAGATVLAARMQFDASGSSEDLRFSSAYFIYTDNMPVDPINCRVLDGSISLTSGANIINPNNNASSAQAYMFKFDNPIIVARGTVKVLSIQCTIPSTATSGSFSWGLNATAVSAVGVSSGTYILPNVLTNAGSTMTVAQSGAGTLSVSTDPSSPSYKLVAGGSGGVDLGVYKFRASGENMTLTKVVFSLGEPPFPGDLTQVRLYDSSANLLATGIFLNNQYATLVLTAPLTLTRDTDVRVVLRGDIAAIGIGKPAHSGDLLAPAIQPGTEATGQSSGNVISAVGSTPVAGVRIFKSYPVIQQIALPTSGLEDGRLLRFAVTANNAGPISLAQIALRFNGIVESTNGQVDLYAYTDANYSSPVLYCVTSGCTNPGAINGLAISGQYNAGYLWFPKPLVIQAAQTVYFEVRDSTKGTGIITTTGGSVSTSLLPATNYSGLYPTSAYIGKEAPFVWSPNTTTTSQFINSDWTVGAGILGFGSMITQVRSASGTVPPTTALPTCSLTSNKTSYTLGETATFSWTSANASYAGFVADTSGKDTLLVPGDKLPTSGSQSIAINVIGNPTVTLKVVSATGATATCSKTIAVSEVTTTPTPTPTDPAPAPVVVAIDPTISPVTVYKDCDFGGASATFRVGSFNLSSIVSKIGNDVISSIKVPNGYTVKLYQHENFGGISRTRLQNDTCFVNNDFNDMTSSMVITAEVPTCTLTASATRVAKGTAVTLTWASTNATHASTATGISNNKVNGSVTVTPTEDSTYVKHVWGPGGEVRCNVAIDVIEDTNTTNARILTRNPLAPILNLLSQMQLGAVVVAETLFGTSQAAQTAAAATSTTGLSCKLKGPATATTDGTITFTWAITGESQTITLMLGDETIGSGLTFGGSQTVTAPSFPAKYNYHLKVSNPNGSTDCYAVVPVLEPGFTQNPLAKMWPQLYGQVGTYGYGTIERSDLLDLYNLGYKLNHFRNSDAEKDADMAAHDAARIDQYPHQALIKMCDQTTKGRSGCDMTNAQQAELLADIKQRLEANKDDEHIVAYMLMDDYAGPILATLEKMRALIVEANKTSVVVRPAICAFNLNSVAISASEGPLRNFSTKACDAFDLYYYGYGGWNPLDTGVYATPEVLNKAFTVLKARGWNKDRQPFIGVVQTFEDDKFGNTSEESVAFQTKAVCEAGAVGILMFEWHFHDYPSMHNTPYMLSGFQKGLVDCNKIWKDKSVTPKPPTATTTQGSTYTCDINASPNHVTAGSDVKLTWKTNSPKGCGGKGFSTSQAWYSSSGSVVVNPNSSRTYGVECKDEKGKVNIKCSTSVTVTSKPQIIKSATSTSGYGEAPTCVLRANDRTVKKGTTITLTWTSKNATESSVEGGGKGGKPQGSIKQTVNHDTTFVKRVYGPGGEGNCTVEVNVAEDTNATKATKVVRNPFAPVTQFLGVMQLGAVVVWETLGLVDSY